jgi:hypothetical protein
MSDSGKLVERIGALLAKAESTDSAAEADALTAKAQQLATMHAIDLAVARERQAQRHRRQVPEQRKVVIGAPREQGRRHRVRLFSTVAHVNDVKVDVARNDTYVLVFGFPDDLLVVEKLYASLVTQMVGAANAAIRRGEHREEQYWSAAAQAWRSDARVFRTAFNLGFVAAVGERLRAARAAALEEDRMREERGRHGDRGAAPGGEAVAPRREATPTGRGALVLARKADEVAQFYADASEARGTWRGGRAGGVAFSAAGHRSGVAAGRSARLSEPQELPGRRGALGGDPD